MSLRLPFLLAGLLAAAPLLAEVPVSPATQGCLDCHTDVTPGIVADWRASAHARTTPDAALKGDAASRRFSAAAAPQGTGGFVVGCAECHTADPDAHADTFDHGDTRVHVVVTPQDCARCHPVESEQFDQNLMAHANGNLEANPLYHDLEVQGTGVLRLDGERLVADPPTDASRAAACLSCHGTRVTVKGQANRETPAGEMSFPVLDGWPNDGVGRVNPDGSLGSCGSCHPRHRFSQAQARRAQACIACHKGPDVPAYAVWQVSRHGALTSGTQSTWNYDATPWVAGRDFVAPTCAACHVSQVATPTGEVVGERTHRMNDRLPWRLFGLPYAHPHPVSPDTSTIRNAAGLALPTGLDGPPVASAVIDAAEQKARGDRLRRVCSACHAQGWVDGHFARLEAVIAETNAQTRTATDLVRLAWKKHLAKGPADQGSPFDEPIERRWVETWLFYANSTRFAAAMTGADYGAFDNGRWWLTRALREMEEWIRDRASRK